METLLILAVVIGLPLTAYTLFSFRKYNKQKKQFDKEMVAYTRDVNRRAYQSSAQMSFIPQQSVSTWDVYSKPSTTPKASSFVNDVLDSIEQQWKDSKGQEERFLNS